MDAAPSPQPNPQCNLLNLGIVLLYIILAVLSMLLLHILGSLRRRTSHSLLHAIVMGVDTLSYPLVSYAIGRMRGSDCYFYDFVVWAVCLLLLLGSTDSLTVLRLDEINNWKSIYIKHLHQAVLLVYIVLEMLKLPEIKYLWDPVFAVLVVGIIKWYVRIASMRMVNKSHLSKSLYVIAEYMKLEDKQTEPFDPVTMKGFRCLVAGEKYCVRRAWDKVATVEKIWQCNGNLLLHEQGKMLKDLCLSMALSKILSRRFAGLKLSAVELENTRPLVFRGLLAGDKPHQRAFRVIEEELAFVHDMYYTRYSYLYQKRRYFSLCLPVVMVSLSSWLTFELIKNKEHHYTPTILITVLFAFLEVYQLYLYIASGWFKVALVQSYVSTPLLQRSGCFLEMIIGLLLRFKAFHPWKDTLGQYCLLRDLPRKRRFRNCLHYATLHLVDKDNKRGRRTSVQLSENVKTAIVDSLLCNNCYLRDGVASLQRIGGHSAIFSDGMVARTILVWHIATTLCRNKMNDTQAKKEDAVRTASTLSNYCMYLLAFAPQLLPDHSSISELIVDQATDEAVEQLKRFKTLDERCNYLMEINTNHAGDEPPLLTQAVQLAKHLLVSIQDPTSRWKFLCDFWVEMMLYVSPSDNARAHLEALAKGGEFITHLWALLSHAGVMKRSPTGPTDIV